MGQVTSTTNWAGYMCGAIMLGVPVEDGNGNYLWDDSSLPDGNVEADNITLTGPVMVWTGTEFVEVGP